MSRALFLAVSMIVLLPGCGNQASAPSSAPEPEVAAVTPVAAPAPPPGIDLSGKFQDLQGNRFDLGVYAGKRIFVNYWATWCAPCIREIPSIERAAAELGSDDYVFLFASDETPDTINDFLIDRGFSGTFIKLNGFFGAYGIQAVPSSELYDENGALVVTWGGAFEWDSPEMLDAIRTGTPVRNLP